jgi:hypothetical protein
MPRIYKLHGTYTKVNPGVIWSELKELQPQKLAHLQHHWENFDFIFVGYSAEDMDIFDALKRTESSKRRGLGTYWFKKSQNGDKVIEIMSKYSTLRNLLALGDTPSGSEIFTVMENELSELSRLIEERKSEDLQKAKEKLSILLKDVNELKQLLDQLSQP